MSNFPKKSFLGITYDFGHLKPIHQQLAINTAKTVTINLNIKFGCHCFTEGFKSDKHSDHHRYVYQGELREQPGVKMFVKSAYLRNHAAKPNAQAWRFVSLAGQIAGVLRK